MKSLSIRISFFFILLSLVHSKAGLYSVEGVSQKPVVIVFGTRPEAIKVIPLFLSLREKGIPTLLCSTGQHAQILPEIYSTFDVTPDIDFSIMKKGQDLFYITQKVLSSCKELFQKVDPSLVIVQGDTTTAMAAALAAFYLHIPVGHVEAGLRTGNMQAPFPEEMNRKLITMVSNLHFAPTQQAIQQLQSEGVSKERIFYTGNTVVDALQLTISKLKNNIIKPSAHIQTVVEQSRLQDLKLFLLTSHRRESIPGGISEIFRAVTDSVNSHNDCMFIYPMHPNPIIKDIAHQYQIDSTPRIHVVEPLAYHDLVYVLNVVDGVLTDSGGIQEEAISLQKKVLILRNETDRPEGLALGSSELVGADYARIIEGVDRVLFNTDIDDSALPNEVYGNGEASATITSIIQQFINNNGKY